MSASNLQETSFTMGNDTCDIPLIPAALHTDTTRHTDTTDQPHQWAADDPEPTAYIPNISGYDRVEMIRRDLRNKHRWSINDFVRYMVTAKSTKPYARTTDTRTKNLTTAIAQDEVIKSMGCSE